MKKIFTNILLMSLVFQAASASSSQPFDQDNDQKDYNYFYSYKDNVDENGVTTFILVTLPYKRLREEEGLPFPKKSRQEHKSLSISQWLDYIPDELIKIILNQIIEPKQKNILSLRLVNKDFCKVITEKFKDHFVLTLFNTSYALLLNCEMG